jgi:quinol monooxygenase YgiN
MTDQPMTVIAQIRINRPMIEEAKKELKKLVTLTQKEPGCICYELHQSADDDTIFLFYERWAQKSDVDKHFKTPHFQAWEQKSASMVVEPVKATFWKHIS